MTTAELKTLLAGATSGPWAMESVRTSCGTCHKVGTFPSANNKTTYACIYDDYPPGVGRPENIANARLIAAAPDIAAEVIRLREALEAAGVMRDAADRVSEWFCTEAPQFEGHRINALRAAMTAYDKHMQPKGEPND